MTTHIEIPARARAEETAAMLKALSHPLRLVIAEHLLLGECTVGGLEEKLGIRQPNLSQYLGALREGGLVTPRREAKQIHYSLNQGRPAELVAFLVRPAAHVQSPETPAASESPHHTHAEPGRRAMECVVFAAVDEAEAMAEQAD
jgi:DNA-binding transcriptional ArsR family regulator